MAKKTKNKKKLRKLNKISDIKLINKKASKLTELRYPWGDGWIVGDKVSTDESGYDVYELYGFDGTSHRQSSSNLMVFVDNMIKQAEGTND